MNILAHLFCWASVAITCYLFYLRMVNPFPSDAEFLQEHWLKVLSIISLLSVGLYVGERK